MLKTKNLIQSMSIKQMKKASFSASPLKIPSQRQRFLNLLDKAINTPPSSTSGGKSGKKKSGGYSGRKIRSNKPVNT